MVGCDFGLQKLRGLAAATQDFCLMTAATLIKITLQRERERESLPSLPVVWHQRGLVAKVLSSSIQGFTPQCTDRVMTYPSCGLFSALNRTMVHGVKHPFAVGSQALSTMPQRVLRFAFACTSSSLTMLSLLTYCCSCEQKYAQYHEN